MSNPPVSAYRWRFFRAGGFDQVKLESGADLMHLDQLDQKLWVALACPTSGLEFDSRTLALIDTDHDGRIRAPELIAAVKWAGSLLKRPGDLVKGGDPLPLASINDDTPEGAQLLASARQILANLGKQDTATISLEEVSNAARIFINTIFNGDGVIIPESSADDALRQVIQDIAACVGTVPDRSGKPGIDQAKVDAFFDECAAYDGWMKQAETDASVLPLGPNTAAAATAVRAVKVKVDDYFGRCRLAAFDPRAATLLNRKDEDYLALAPRDLSLTAAEVAGFPLAKAAAGKPLPLAGAVNPAHAASLGALQTSAVKPLLGDKASLTEADWIALQARLGAFECWNAGKAGAGVEKLGLKHVRELLAGKARDELTALIAKDKELEPQANSIAAVERLVRYHRDLHLLCRNFVNFKDLYDRGEPAIFQAGTLYLDQRSCTFTLPVDDAGRHAKLAGLAGTYLAYCDCVRKGTGEKRQIVAAFTDGESENLMVGRNGVFYDRKGHDWDATITKIIDNPISLRQAFWSPYKKFVRFIEEQVAKRAAAADGASASKLQAAAAAAEGDKSKAPTRKVDVGTVAALGVAFGAIGAFATAIWAQLLGIIRLGPFAILGAIIALIVLISGPSLILAYIKLRKRNLGPILDANGWAVNTRARINVPFGKSLTQVAKLPPDAQRDLTDPFPEKKHPWKLYLLLLILLLLAFYWYKGSFDRSLPSRFKSISVLGTNAPAYRVRTNAPPMQPPPGL